MSTELLQQAISGTLQIMIIKPEYLKKIKGDDDLKYSLAKVNRVKVSTIERWFRVNDPMLTTASNLPLIASALSVSHNEILTEAIPA